MARSAATPAGAGLYRVGTLVYTRRALVGVFLWMLWGNFCFTMMEMILPRLLPLQLKDLGASNFAIIFLTGTIPSAMNFVVAPIVSFRSDRYRSRWGRRIPFLLWPTPFLALFLILLGYSAATTDALQRWGIAGWVGLSSTGLSLLWIGLLVVGFVFFNMFVASVYYYLFNDVVPQQFLGRFMALYGIVGTAGAFVFNYFIFGWAEGHMKHVYLGVSLLYLVSFLLMCWGVREGEYPPPPPNEGGPGILAAVQTYFRECYSHPYYLWFFVGTALWSVSQAAATFAVFFAKDIGLSTDDFGKVLGWTSLLAAVILYPIGALVDRLHPLRMVLFGIAALVPFNAIFFFFVDSHRSFLVVSLLSLLPTAIFGAANLPMYMSILPKERYGQFCSAQAMVNAVLMVGGTALAGKFMDWMHNDYRYLYVWMFCFQSLAVICLFMVYCGWLKHGGPGAYVPPSVQRLPSYNARRTAAPAHQLDWSDPAWQVAGTASIDSFHLRSSVHRPRTLARVLYDDEALYVAFKVEDRFVRSVSTEYQGRVWTDSCVELWIRPKADGGWFNFECNCGATLLIHCHEIDPATGETKSTPLPPELGRQVEVVGSMPAVVDPEITESVTWQLRMRIPLRVLEARIGLVRPLHGQTWRGNFCKCADETSHPHWGSWASIGAKLSFSQPERFGTITFC